MNQQNTHILTLIKLLEGHLSDAEGLSVREQLASDSLLLKRWKTLSQLYEQEISLEVPEIQNVVAIDAESIAAFVEERMSPHQRLKFETECWNHTNSLREVISAYQAVHSDISTTRASQQDKLYSAQTSKRMNDVVKTQCVMTDSLPIDCNYLQEIKDDSQSHLHPATQDSSESNEESIISRPRSVKSNRQSVTGNKRILQRQQKTYIAIAIVLIGIAIPVYFGFFQEWENASITKSPVPKPSPSILQKPRSNPKQVLQSDNASKLTVVPEVKPMPDTPKPSIKIVSEPPVINKQADEKPLMAKKGTASDPVTKIDLQIDWVQMSGIIGSRSSVELPWKGILADASTKQITDEKYLELHTLPFSWVQGNMKSKSGGSGPGFVLDSDSEIQIAIRAVKTQSKVRQSDAESAQMQTVIDLTHIAGRVAFSQLQAGDELQFQDQRQQWLVQVKQAGTSIGFVQQNENRREIMVFSGKVQVASKSSQQSISLNSDQMIVMRNHSFGAPSKVVGKQSWHTEPPKSLKLSKSFIEKMNQSDDLLSALLALPADRVGVELLASTNLGFALDPVATVAQAAYSKSEIQRTAAITWLIAAKEDPATTAVWRKLNDASNSSPASPSIRVWFNIAQGKSPGNQKFLAELSAGLGPTQPLFVRQCSIHFLRQLTRQRFAEYDPSQPTAAAIKNVRKIIRRATGNVRPKSNTRPQGNNSQRRK